MVFYSLAGRTDNIGWDFGEAKFTLAQCKLCTIAMQPLHCGSKTGDGGTVGHLLHTCSRLATGQTRDDHTKKGSLMFFGRCVLFPCEIP